jgi:hypothetical protein
VKWEATGCGRRSEETSIPRERDARRRLVILELPRRRVPAAAALRELKGVFLTHSRIR